MALSTQWKRGTARGPGAVYHRYDIMCNDDGNLCRSPRSGHVDLQQYSPYDNLNKMIVQHVETGCDFAWVGTTSRSQIQYIAVVKCGMVDQTAVADTLSLDQKQHEELYP